MKLTKTQLTLLGVNGAVVLGFGAYYLQSVNYEFFAYAITIAVVTAALFGTLRWTRFSHSWSNTVGNPAHVGWECYDCRRGTLRLEDLSFY